MLITYAEARLKFQNITFLLMIIAFLTAVVTYFLKWQRTHEFKYLRNEVYKGIFTFIVSVFLMSAAYEKYDSMYAEACENIICKIFSSVPIVFYLAISFAMILEFIHNIGRMFYENRQQVKDYSIKETYDKLPFAICYANKEGMPILTNSVMYKLMFSILKKHFYNAKDFWSELVKSTQNENEKLNQDRDFAVNIQKYSNKIDINEDLLFVCEGEIWNFKNEKVLIDMEEYTKISAVNVTEFYQLSENLINDTKKLELQQKRLNELLNNIVASNEYEEILSSKIEIHQKLGSNVLSMQKFLKENNDENNFMYKDVLEMWKMPIKQLTSNPNDLVKELEKDDEESKSSLVKQTFKELSDVASELGVNIVYEGLFPTCNLILISALREILTNAVRHAKATEVYVKTEYDVNEIVVEMWDNGEGFSGKELKLGNGLTSLKEKVERSGNIIDISIKDGRIYTKIVIMERKQNV